MDWEWWLVIWFVGALAVCMFVYSASAISQHDDDDE